VGSPVEVARAQRELPPLRTVVLDGASARSQSERAYLLIRDQIVTLKLRPAAVIEESRLRQELQLGRTPIREALQRLAHEKLVSFVPHRGTFVTDINITDLARLTEVRVELEGYAARLAAERATPQDREALELLRRELTELDIDPEGLIHLDQRIHRMVYRASHNHFLEDVCERYFNLSLRLWFLVLPRLHLKEAVEEQAETLDAVLAREGPRAEAALRRHVMRFEEQIRKVL
jgi:DNA-binding GntR family transcriptional regulator